MRAGRRSRRREPRAAAAEPNGHREPSGERRRESQSLREGAWRWEAAHPKETVPAVEAAIGLSVPSIAAAAAGAERPNRAPRIRLLRPQPAGAATPIGRSANARKGRFF